VSWRSIGIDFEIGNYCQFDDILRRTDGAAMPTRNINLTKHFDDFVEKSVSTGEYQNASEVVRDALRLLQSRRQEEKLKLQRLREAIDVGLKDLEDGNYIELKPHEIGPWLSSLGKRSRSNVGRRRRK
jgi:antitoxin ParD1/3/4